MAKKLKPGDVVRGYRVVRVLGPGMMAIAYVAETPEGGRVFLKQYKSPSPAVVWYRDFVDYQRELSRRVQEGKAAHYAVRLIEAFEETWGGLTYFAVYEFVEDGRDLDDMLADERDAHRLTRTAPTRDPAVWSRHVTWAKVLMAGVAALHESQIIHADLKPGNALLIKDATLNSGYRLRLIDTDFSILSDRRAPWHGYQGYVGTDNYRSIEHMTKGAVPVLASDVFTCGLILYELLAGGHPYWHEDQAEYARRARAYRLAPPTLLGPMPAPADNRDVSAVLHRCLNPDPSARPTAAQVRAALGGRAPGTPARPQPVAARTALTSANVQFVTAGGEPLRVGIRTVVGKAILRRLGADAEFWDDAQCTVERRADGSWILTPQPGTVNETLINGAPVSAPQTLSEGDVVAVGNSTKGISKLPLTVRAG